MFEKEAENYANKQIGCGDGYYEWTDVKQSFKDGAEFGYNFAKEEMDYLNKHWGNGKDKANEWHFVKDGDYPKDNKTVLALCIVGGEPYPYLAQYWKGFTDAKKNGVDLNWNCWLNNLQREVVEPYAWREITIPELKESE